MRATFADAALDAVVDAFIEAGKLEPGDTARFNHGLCEDSRARGYVTRKYSDRGDEVNLFYCHNCGYSDARAHPGALFARPGAAVLSSEEGVLTLPSDVTPITDGAPSAARTWAFGYGVQDRVMWSPSLGRIILPVYATDGVLLGYQARRAPRGSTRVPKYITVARRDRPLRMRVLPSSFDIKEAPLIVFVEDWVSAHQFTKFSNVIGVPLFGVNVSAEHVIWADRCCSSWTKAPRYLVWLDNDVREAQEASQYLCRLLTAMGRIVRIEPNMHDPKDTERSMLAKIINDAREF